MKILLLNTQMEAGGAQKAMLTLARGLQRRGHAVTVATMYDKADYVPLFRQKYGVQLIDLDMKPSSGSKLVKMSAALKGLLDLWRMMRREKFDVLQTFSHYSNILGPLVAFLAGLRCRISSQRMSLKGSPSWLLRLDRWVANSFLIQKMVTVSEGTRQFCIAEQGIKPNKLLTIRNSIDLNRFSAKAFSADQKKQLRDSLGLPEKAQVVIAVARLHPQKGHQYLITAIPGIKKTFPRTHFLFVGEGKLEKDLKDLITQTDVEENVHFLGMRQDIPELLALSDIFILPSLWEGLPNSVLEAMAMQTAVIATNVDGSPEVIQDGVTGFLIQPKDPQAIAQSVTRLLTDTKLRSHIAQNALDWVAENCAEEKKIGAFEALYESIVNGKK